MQRENVQQYKILQAFYLPQMRIFVTQNRMSSALFGYIEVLRMNMNQFTQKSIEALRDMQSAALENGNQQIEQVHLLHALISEVFHGVNIHDDALIAAATSL